MLKYFRKPTETISDGDLKEPNFWRLSARILLIAFLVTLPFFQPGLGWITAILAFTYGTKRWGFFAGLASAAIYTALYALISIFVLPIIHIYTIAAWQYVLIWGSALAAMIISIASVLQGRVNQWGSKTKTTVHLITWGLALFVATGSWLASRDQDVVEWTMAEVLDPQVIQSLPNTDAKNFRMLPQATAISYLQNLNGDTRTVVSEPHMAPCDSSGNQCWEGSFHLKGKDEGIWYNFFFDTVLNVATVDPTHVNMKGTAASGFNGFFLAGPKSWIVQAAFAVHNPFSEQQEALYWRNDDDHMVMLIPYISYRPTITGVMLPELAGVMSVNRFGLINDMSPATARANYPNMPFYPTKLARKYAEIFAKWNGGIQGRMVTKNHELRVSEPDATNQPHFNKAPYIEVYDNLGWQEVIALEPKGDDSAKLAKILFFDAASGFCRQYIVPDITLNGPRQAIIQVMQGNWNADWTNYQKVEPRPLMVNGHVYYVVAIISTAGTKHPYVHSVVIDGQTLKSYEVGDHEELFSLVDKLERKVYVEPMKMSGGSPTPSLQHELN